MKKLLIAIPILLIVVLIAGKISADNAGQTYLDKLKSQSMAVNKISDIVAPARFADYIAVGRNETPDERAAITQNCGIYDKAVREATSLQKSTHLPTNQFGFVSATYKRAQKQQSATDQLGTITARLSELAHGCSMYNRSLQAYDMSNKSETARKALLIHENCVYGTTECLPIENAAAYKPLYAEIVEFDETIAKQYSNDCVFPELSKVCQIYAKYTGQRAVAERAYYISLPDGKYDQSALEVRKITYPTDEICAAALTYTDTTIDRANCFTRSIKDTAARRETEAKKLLRAYAISVTAG